MKNVNLLLDDIGRKLGVSDVGIINVIFSLLFFSLGLNLAV